MNIKALALDLDGTALLPNSFLGERTLKVLKKLLIDGMEIIICTGRAIEAAEPFRAAIGTEGPMVFFNGAEVVDMPSGKRLKSTMLELEITDYCIDLARTMNIHFQIYLPPGVIEGHDRWEPLLIDKANTEAELYSKHTGIIPVVQDLKKAIAIPSLQGCVKAMFICEPELHDQIRVKLSQRYGKQIYMSRTSHTFLEVMNDGVSKGEGLLTALQHRGIDKSTVLALGDEENDLSMFEIAGFSAAPSSGRENIKSAADFIFGACAEEGLAAFLEEKFL